MNEDGGTPEDALTVADIPDAASDWPTLIRFAHTFDAYRHHGSFEAAAHVANARRHETLADLRTCLFFEARRWRHFGEDPTPDEEAYMRGLVEKIREAVSARRRD